jgi:hypothetical protein
MIRNKNRQAFLLVFLVCAMHHGKPLAVAIDVGIRRVTMDEHAESFFCIKKSHKVCCAACCAATLGAVTVAAMDMANYDTLRCVPLEGCTAIEKGAMHRLSEGFGLLAAAGAGGCFGGLLGSKTWQQDVELHAHFNAAADDDWKKAKFD